MENGGGTFGRGGTRSPAPTLRRLAGAPGLALRGLLGLVYPPVCIACGAATGSPHGLCAGCWTGMRFIERPWCERLGTPFAVDLGVPGLISPAAMAAPPVFARARSVARYDDTARRLVHRLKYETGSTSPWRWADDGADRPRPRGGGRRDRAGAAVALAAVAAPVQPGGAAGAPRRRRPRPGGGGRAAAAGAPDPAAGRPQPPRPGRETSRGRSGCRTRRARASPAAGSSSSTT